MNNQYVLVNFLLATVIKRKLFTIKCKSKREKDNIVGGFG